MTSTVQADPPADNVSPPRQLTEKTLWFQHGLGALGVTLLFVMARFIPLLDWPQHLLNVSVLAHFHDPAWGFGRFYDLDPQVTTYLGTWIPAALMANVVSLEAALRAVTWAGLVATPPAVSYMLAGLRKSPYYGLLTWPWVYSFSFWMGFIPFVDALPLGFLAIGIAARLGRRGGRPLAVALTATLALTFFVHSFAWMVFTALTAAVGALYSGRNLRHWLLGALAISGSAILWAIWFITHYQLSSADALGANITLLYDASSLGNGLGGGSSETVIDRLRSMPSQLTEHIRANTDGAILSIAAGVSLVVALVAASLPRPSCRRPHLDKARAAAVAALLCAPALLIPYDLAGVHAVGPRFVVVFIIGLVVLLATELAAAPRARRLLFTPFPLLSVWMSIVCLDVFNDTAAENEGFDEVVEALPRGAALYGLIDSPGSQFVLRPPFLHAGAAATARRGGAIGFSFFNNLSVPVRVRHPGELPYSGRRAEWEPSRFTDDLYGFAYEYLLVRGPNVPIQRRLRTRRSVWSEVTSSGVWRLYRRNEPETRAGLYSLLERIHRADVSATAERTPCPMGDRFRHQCPQADWVWVGPTEQEFSQRSHPCIWAHPLRREPITISWNDIPAEARSLRGWAGLADSAFTGGRPTMDTVSLQFAVDGQAVEPVEVTAVRGTQVFDLPLPPSADGSSPRTLTATISTADDARRHFCFDALVMGAPGSRLPLPADEN